MFCTKCGKRNPDEAVYCMYCGAALSGGKASVNKQQPARKGAGSLGLYILGIGMLVLVVFSVFSKENTSSKAGSTGRSSYAVTTQAPTTAPTNNYVVPLTKPSAADLYGHPDIEVPQSYAWMPDYNKICCVQSSGGVCIYLLYVPRAGKGHFDTINDGEYVTVLAEQDGYSLVYASDGRVGWANSKYLVEQSEAYGPPETANSANWPNDGTYFVYLDDYWTDANGYVNIKVDLLRECGVSGSVTQYRHEDNNCYYVTVSPHCRFYGPRYLDGPYTGNLGTAYSSVKEFEVFYEFGNYCDALITLSGGEVVYIEKTNPFGNIIG